MTSRALFTSIVPPLILAGVSHAAYVTPTMGGGQVGMASAPMLHTDIGFDGVNLTATVDTSHGAPTLRALTPPDEFDPAQPWAVLQHKAYNFQHAWNPSGFITLPTGAGIWIERVSQDAELETYLRPPASPAYTRVFENDGDRWQWSGAMTHNVYAVLNPSKPEYAATYRIYLGDGSSGEPLSGYGSATVSWTWQAVVVPEPASLALLALAMLGRRR